MLSGSQRSTSQYNRACCCSNCSKSEWLLCPQLLAQLHAAVISGHIPPLTWEPLGSSLASGRSLPWMTGQEAQRPGKALIPLPDSCSRNGLVYAAFLTFASSLLCWICKVVWWSVKVYFSSVSWTQHNLSICHFCLLFFIHRLNVITWYILITFHHCNSFCCCAKSTCELGACVWMTH